MKELSVHLDFETRVPVGTLAEDGRKVYWEFDPSFVASGLAISPYALPTRPGLHEHPHKPGVPLPGVFSDSRPDGWGLKLLHRQFAEVGRPASSVSPLDELAYLGRRTMGALVYEPTTGPPSLHEAVELGALAAHAREVYQGDAATTLPALVHAGGSPGGARPKVLVGRSGDRVCIGEADLPPGFTHWLVKFERPEDDTECARREVAWMTLARRAGLVVADCEALDLGAAGTAFATRRFDRTPSRLHVLSAAGALDVDFRTATVDYRDLARLSSLICRGDLREVAAVVRLAMFNVVAHNEDDHLKNLAWCYDGKAWRVAPAYDLTYAPHASGHRATPVLGQDQQVPRSALLDLASVAGLSARAATAMLDEVLQAAATVGEVLSDLACTNRVSQEAARTVSATADRLAIGP